MAGFLEEFVYIDEEDGVEIVAANADVLNQGFINQELSRVDYDAHELFKIVSSIHTQMLKHTTEMLNPARPIVEQLADNVTMGVTEIENEVQQGTGAALTRAEAKLLQLYGLYDAFKQTGIKEILNRLSDGSDDEDMIEG